MNNYSKYVNKENYYPYYIKQLDGMYYLYNIATNGIFLLDDNGYKVFVDDDNIENYFDIFEFARENYILKTEENTQILDKGYHEISANKKNLRASALTLMISQKCNLRCKYCYGEGGEYNNKGEMNFDIAKKAVDYLVNVSKNDDLSICFFGGEPLMNFKLIKQVIDYSKLVEQNSKKQFTYSMTTNATLIDDKVKEYIKENRISLTVSLDGDKEINDSNRYFVNEKGIYDTVVEKINGLRDSIMVRATIAPPNFDLCESINHLVRDLEIDRVAWAEADNLLSEIDYHKITISYLKLIDEVEEMILNKEYKEAKKYYMICNMLRKFKSDGIRTKGCGAGNNMIAVDIDGKVYPCHRFVGLDEFVIDDVEEEGRAYNQNGVEFYKYVDLANFEECTNCLAKNICGGGCINQNYHSTYNINKPSLRHCEYTKIITDRLLETFIKLSREDRECVLGS